MRLDEWFEKEGRMNKWLVQRLGVSSTTVSNWKNGNKTPSITHQAAIQKLTHGKVRINEDWPCEQA